MKFPQSLCSRWFPLVVPLFISFLLYARTFSGEWGMDDYSVIVNNPDIRSFSNFLTNTFPGRPLREISFLVDHFFFGLDPWGYHFQNIFWHALNCWLVYCMAIRLKLSVAVAWVASLLFLVHPIHVEVVANSSHRKDSLALAFLLMALLAYMKIFDQTEPSRRFFWLITSCLLWITAFFAKGNSLVFPVIVIAYEYIVIPEGNRLFVKSKRLVPFLSISSLVGLVVWYIYISTLPSFKMAIIGAFVKTENLASFSVEAYILMVLKSFAFMFSKLIFPINLSMEYIYAVPKSLFDPWVFFAFVIITACLALAYRWKKTSPHLFFPLVLAAILWVPTANIIWHFSYFAADRYMYAPSVGLCILAAVLSDQLFSAARQYFVFAWIGILSSCAILTWYQSDVWRNEMNLYSHMLKVSPRSLEAMVGLSNTYYTVKNYEMSARYSQQALERDPTDYRPYLIAGNINYVHSRLNEALELLLQSQKRNPLSPEVHNALGITYDDLGKTELAIQSFKTALKLRVDYYEAYTNLGVTYERAHNLVEAESSLKKALAIKATHAPAWFNLGIIRYKNNDTRGARQAFLEAAKCDPLHVDALTNLSIVCKEIGDDVCHDDAVRRLGTIEPGTVNKLIQR